MRNNFLPRNATHRAVRIGMALSLFLSTTVYAQGPDKKKYNPDLADMSQKVDSLLNEYEALIQKQKNLGEQLLINQDIIANLKKEVQNKQNQIVQLTGALREKDAQIVK